MKCACGCGQTIVPKAWHKYQHVRYIHNHYQAKLARESTPAELKRKHGWSKGLTKESDSRILQQSRNISKALKGKKSPLKGRTYKQIFGSRTKDIIDKHKMALRGKPSKLRGRTYEQIHGIEKAKKLRMMRADSRITAKRLSAGSQRPNKLERRIQEKLQRMFPNDTFEYCGNGKVVINGRCPDFISSKTKRVVLVHGIYWHLLRKGIKDTFSNRCIIEIQDARPFEKAGYKVTFFWERRGRDVN
jgi:G:T-mismatch repair DNA endonuclease (very short patch repair protein)